MPSGEIITRFGELIRIDRHQSRKLQAALYGLDKYPGTLLELFPAGSNIQGGRQPDTIANGLPR
jgi:hypothetical protein